MLMRLLRATGMAMLLVMTVTTPAAVHGQAPSQDGFVPVDQLPGQEELPAAPLVAAAYGVAWAAVLLYLVSIWRRLATVERDIAEVARRIETRAGR